MSNQDIDPDLLTERLVGLATPAKHYRSPGDAELAFADLVQDVFRSSAATRSAFLVGVKDATVNRHGVSSGRAARGVEEMLHKVMEAVATLDRLASQLPGWTKPGGPR